MKFIPVKTRRFQTPQDDIYNLLEHLPRLRNKDVLFITSKVLAIHQGRCVKITPKIDKDALIKSEAESYIPRKLVPGKYTILAIKDHTLIASAGIDESNANGYYVLWPKNVNTLLKNIWQYLKRKHKLKKLGIIATDSHLVPMRRGTVGVSIGAYGLEPLRDYRGKPDLFGRNLKVTQSNIIDALSSGAVLLMGEGRESRPLLIARGAPVNFTNRSAYHKLTIPKQLDIYAPLLKAFKSHGKNRIHSRRRSKSGR